MEKDIIILYHAKCFDGFGAAWAAYKKFGNTAEYIPVNDHTTPPDGLDGKEIYIVDFSYPKDILLDIEQRAKELVVIDHHKSAEEDVRAVKEHVFDLYHSGAILTWQYFFPDEEPPLLLKYVEDGDLWRFNLPLSEAARKILEITPFEFSDWGILVEKFEDDEARSKLLEKGAIYKEYWDTFMERVADSAREVEFEGHEVLALNAPGVFRHHLGHILVLRKPPFAIIWGHKKGGMLTFSLRGDGSIDVAEIAEKYGGGGHHDAAAFRILNAVKLPFTFIEESNE